jgi:exodeoxyribonuclease VII small subunit
MAKALTLETLLSGDVTPEQLSTIPFEQALGLLEEVVCSVESGNLPLDKAIGSYERGTILVQHLRRLLSGAEEKLRLLQKGAQPAE